MDRHVAVVVLLLAAGCTSTVTKPPGVHLLSGSPAASQPTVRKGTSAASGAGSHNRPGAGASGSSGSAPRNGAASREPHDAGEPGSNAFFYLNRTTPTLTVEIDAVRGQAPSSSTIDLLRTRLREVVDKPGGIDVLPVQTIAESHSQWSDADIAAAEKHNRSHFNRAGSAVMYFLFLDGKPSNADAIGLTYSASASAIFTDLIRQSSTLLVSAESIEQAATVHETGHLLSLVNLGYRSPRDHEDQNHPHHSTDPDSVMYWAVDNVGVANLLGGRTAPPTDFDSDDRADLADVKAGRL